MRDPLSVPLPDVFAAGISAYDIADLVHLGRQMHKFEKYDTVLLVVPYPEGVDVHRKRSLVNAAHRLRCHLLLLQGFEDIGFLRTKPNQCIRQPGMREATSDA